MVRTNRFNYIRHASLVSDIYYFYMRTYLQKQTGPEPPRQQKSCGRDGMTKITINATLVMLCLESLIGGIDYYSEELIPKPYNRYGGKFLLVKVYAC